MQRLYFVFVWFLENVCEMKMGNENRAKKKEKREGERRKKKIEGNPFKIQIQMKKDQSIIIFI